ncbi:MAG: hypothetical protein JW888_05180 [Pirellulales bacterium]|nr:hypothetical protein [Pirellulales bacterium]
MRSTTGAGGRDCLDAARDADSGTAGLASGRHAVLKVGPIDAGPLSVVADREAAAQDNSATMTMPHANEASAPGNVRALSNLLASTVLSSRRVVGSSATTEVFRFTLRIPARSIAES